MKFMNQLAATLCVFQGCAAQCAGGQCQADGDNMLQLLKTDEAAQISQKIVDKTRSPNGGYYECEPSDPSGLCMFTLTDDGVTELGSIVEHNVDITVGEPFYRQVADPMGNQLKLSAKPWSNGDQLIASSVALEGDEWYYALAFEMIAPLRDLMMYHPETLKDNKAEWIKYTKPLVDCLVKNEDEWSDDHNKYILGVDSVYTYLTEVTESCILTKECDHHNILQFLEEGAIDFVCIMTEFEMDRCDVMRDKLSMTAGARCNCWMPGYLGIYNNNATVTSSDFTSCDTTGTSTASTTVTPTDKPSATSTATPPTMPTTPTSSPSAVPVATQGKCEDFCDSQGNKQGWGKVCAWRKCSSCSACSAPTAAPTAVCKPWCAGSAKQRAGDWTKVCTWNKCSGCFPCFVEQVLRCEKFCDGQGNALGWHKVCAWKACSNCYQCHE